MESAEEAVDLIPEICSAAAQLLVHLQDFPDVFHFLADHFLTPEVLPTLLRIGRLDEDVEVALVQEGAQRGMVTDAMVCPQLLSTLTNRMHFDAVLEILRCAELSDGALVAAQHTTQIPAHEVAMRVPYPGLSSREAPLTLLHLAAVCGERAIVSRLFSIKGCVTRSTACDMLCHCVRGTPDVGWLWEWVPVADASDEPGRWPSGTTLHLYHWLLILPARETVLRSFVAAAQGFNFSLPATVAAPLSLTENIRLRPMRTVNVFARREKCDLQQVHPLLLCVAPLHEEFQPPLSERTAKLHLLLSLVSPPQGVAKGCLAYLLYHRAWKGSPTSRQVLDRLLRLASVDLHYAFGLLETCDPDDFGPGDDAVLSQLVRNHASSLDLNACNEDGHTPLLFAATLSLPTLVSELLHRGSTAGASEVFGKALLFANEECLRVLSATVAHHDHAQWGTPLHLACAELRGSAIVALLSARPEASRVVDSLRRTPPHVLFESLHKQPVDGAKHSRLDKVGATLVEKTSLVAADGDGVTVLGAAVRAGCLSVVSSAVERDDFPVAVRRRSRHGYSVLHLAALCKYPTCFEIFNTLRRGAGQHAGYKLVYDAKDNAGRTPLHLALHEHFNIDLVRQLLTETAPTSFDSSGKTPITAAPVSILVDLVGATPNVNFGGHCTTADTSGETLLHRLASEGVESQGFFAYITHIDHRDRLDQVLVQDKAGDTPIHILLRSLRSASTPAKRQSVSALIMEILEFPEKCAVPFGSGRDGQSLLHLSAAAGLGDVVEALLRTVSGGQSVPLRGVSPVPPDELALQGGHTRLAWQLWVRRGGPQPLDSERRNIVLQAAALQPVRVLETVLSPPCPDREVLCVDKEARNLLHCCCLCPREANAKLLVALREARELSVALLCGVSRDSEHPTPLHMAVAGGYYDAVCEMLSCGADPMGGKVGAAPIVTALVGGQDRIALVLHSWMRPEDCAEVTDADHRTILHLAIRYSKLSTVKALVSGGAKGWKGKGRNLSPSLVLVERDPALHSRDPPGTLAALLQMLRRDSGRYVGRVRRSELSVLLLSGLKSWLKARRAGRGPGGWSLSPADMAAELDFLLTAEANDLKGLGDAIVATSSLMVASYGAVALDGSDGANPSLRPFAELLRRYPPDNLPPSLSRHLPPIHRLALIHLAAHDPVASNAMVESAMDDPRTAAFFVPAVMYFPSASRIAEMASKCTPTTLVGSHSVNVVFRAVCTKTKAWKLATQHGGDEVQLRLATQSLDDVGDYLPAFLAGRHSENTQLLQTVLNYRPPIPPNLVQPLRNRGGMELTNAFGDSILHLIIMNDNVATVAQLEMGECDPCAVNNFGLNPIDYCQTSDMMATLVAHRLHPPLLHREQVQYCIVLSNTIRVTFLEDPYRYIVDSFMIYRNKPILRQKKEGTLEELRHKLTEQCVLVLDCPAKDVSLWALALPKRTACRLLGQPPPPPLEANVLAVNVGRPEESLAIDAVGMIELTQKVLNPFVSGIDLVDLMDRQLVFSVFPVYSHDESKTGELLSTCQDVRFPYDDWVAWLGHRAPPPDTPKYPLIGKFKAYLGERTAFYYGWFVFYQYWLHFLFVPGVVFQILQFTEGFSTPLSGLYTVLVLIWAFLFTKCWDRKERELAAEWGVYKRPKTELPRPTFRPLEDADGTFLIEPDPIDPSGNTPLFPPSIRRKRYIVSSVVVVLFLGVSIAEFMLFMWIRDWLQDDPSGSVEDTGGTATVPDPAASSSSAGGPLFLAVVSALHTLVLMALEAVYRLASDRLNNWENHRLSSTFSRSLILKYMTLQMLNAFLPPMWIVFSDGKRFGAEPAFRNGAIHIASRLVVELLLGAVYEYGILYCVKILRKKELPALTAPGAWGSLLRSARLHIGEGYDREDFRVTYGEYAELMLQFAYIVCFAPMCPAAPLLAALNNYFELRGDVYKMLELQERCLPSHAQGIGAWSTILRMLVVVSTVTNSALLFLSDHPVQDTLGLTGSSKVAVFFGAEQGLLLVFCVLLWAIPSAPAWASKLIHQHESERDWGPRDVPHVDTPVHSR